MSDLTDRLVLGTMYFGTRTDEVTSRALLDRFVEAGGRTIDTADCYSFWTSDTGAGGQSEAVIGRWLADHPGLRDELVIATKIGVEPVEPGRFDGPVEGLSAQVVHREVFRSMERLGLDRLDLLWAHAEDRDTELTETVAAMGALVSSGVVRRLGASNHATWRVERARRIAADLGVEPYTAIQPTTSYVHPRPGAQVPGKDHPFGFLTPEGIDHARENHLEIWAYSPLVQGSYDRADRPFPEEYDHPGTTRRLGALARVADELAARPSQVVLAWLLRQDPPVRPILGVSSVEQLDSALAAGRLELDEDALDELDQPG